MTTRLLSGGIAIYPVQSTGHKRSNVYCC